MLNNPGHYIYGEYEVKDVIKDWGLNFSLGNVIKYVARAEHSSVYYLVHTGLRIIV